VDAESIGAVLSGVAAVLSSAVSLRIARRRAEADCEKRIEEVMKAFELGQK
jgi:hypothetical protein